MNNVANNPITEEQLKAAHETIAQATAQGIQDPSDSIEGSDPLNTSAQDNVTVSVSYDGPVSLPGASPTLEEPDVPDETDAVDKKKQELRAKFEETINNPRFWAKESRHTTLMSAMSVPVFDDRSLHQYYIHSEADLKAEAATKSFKTGVPAVLPSEEGIKAEAWKRWVADETKEVTKSLNKQRRDEAKKAGIKFIPVPPEEVKAIVDKAEAQLRASENC